MNANSDSSPFDRAASANRAGAAALLVAAFAAAFGRTRKAEPKKRKPFPSMVCSPPEEIAAWNAAVAARSDRLDRIAERRRIRQLARGS